MTLIDSCFLFTEKGAGMKRVNKRTEIGIDTIEINITGIKTAIEETELKHTRTGENIGTIKKRNGREQGYVISICLPKIIRTDNIKPFGVLDSIKLSEVIWQVQTQLSMLFNTDYKNAYVKCCEVNATATLKRPENIDAIMNLLSLMFLQAGEKVYLTAHGVKDTRYRNVPVSKNILRQVQQVESLKTKRSTNERVSWKLYNKSLEQAEKAKSKKAKSTEQAEKAKSKKAKSTEQAEKGILRLEERINEKGLAFIGLPLRLDKFLISQNIKRLVEQYQRDFRELFLNQYWKKGDEDFTDTLVNTIVFDLQDNTPLVTAKIHRNLLYIDITLFKKACLEFYDNRKIALQAVRRVKQSGTVMYHTGAVTELVEIFRAIVY